MGRLEEEHLRRFVAARDRGDEAEMRRWWEAVLVDVADRIDGFVYLAHKGRLDDDEHEQAVERCLVRFALRLMWTFEGTSMGQLVNACQTMASFICMDVQRRSIRDRRGPSLDAGWDADAEDRAAHPWEAEEAARRFEAQERDAEIADFLAWALPQVQESRRRVLELTFHGAEIAEIVDALGITRDNAYQLRSRGLRDLTKLKEQYDA